MQAEPGMRKLLWEISDAFGLDAIVCANDNDAIKYLKSPQGAGVSVILCDAPVSGAKNAFVGRVRAYEGSSRVPVLVLSHTNGLSERSHAFEMGASEYMTRPVSPQELLARLRHWSGRVHEQY